MKDTYVLLLHIYVSFHSVVSQPYIQHQGAVKAGSSCTSATMTSVAKTV